MNPILIGIGIVLVAGGIFFAVSQSDDSSYSADTWSDKEAMSEEKMEDMEMEAEMEGEMEIKKETPATVESETTVEAEAEVNVEAPAPATVNITGKSFEFSQSEIRVQEGQTVTVNFTSTGGLHDWVVDEFDAATGKVSTDGSTSVTFVADKAGTYEYYCSVGNHRAQGMVGTLIVE